jgi:hypothetical protein
MQDGANSAVYQVPSKDAGPVQVIVGLLPLVSAAATRNEPLP